MAKFENFLTKNDVKIQINMEHVMRITESANPEIDVYHFTDGSSKQIKKLVAKSARKPATKPVKKPATRTTRKPAAKKK